MTKIVIQKLNGTPLIKNIPVVNFIRSDFGRELFRAYNERVERDYNENKNLQVLKLKKGGEVIGGNIFAISLINDVVRDLGLHPVNQAELEEILNAGVEKKLASWDIYTALVMSGDKESYKPH